MKNTKPEEKPILAIETSNEICGAAILFNEEKFAETNLKIKHIHSEKILEVVESVLKITNIKLNDCKAIAVSSGPGSFTGLRIGMSTAKGLAFGANLPIIPVPTFDALAFQISKSIPENSGFIIANRVNLEELYYAKFIKQNNNYNFVDELQVIHKEELESKKENEILIFGNAEGTIHNFSSPNASSIAKWAYLFGKDLLNYNFDFLEPNYLKNFVTKQG